MRINLNSKTINSKKLIVLQLHIQISISTYFQNKDCFLGPFWAWAFICFLGRIIPTSHLPRDIARASISFSFSRMSLAIPVHFALIVLCLDLELRSQPPICFILKYGTCLLKIGSNQTPNSYSFRNSENERKGS